MFKTYFPDQRSPPIPGDHRRSLAFTQPSSGAIPAIMGDYQRFLKRYRTLTRTSCFDGPLTYEYEHTTLPIDRKGIPQLWDFAGHRRIALAFDTVNAF